VPQRAYAIPAKRQLVIIVPETGELLSERKYPKIGKVYDFFSELIRIPHLVINPNLTINNLLIVIASNICIAGYLLI